MTDVRLLRHVTQHLDRHNDYIVIYERYLPYLLSTYTDDGEAIEDLLYRIPDTATPHQVAAVIGRAMAVVEELGSEVRPDLSVQLRRENVRGESGRYMNSEALAQAYLAVDLIDVEEVLARE